MTQFLDQVYVLGRRSVVRTVRQPANVVAPLLFPMLLLAVNSGGLKAETNLPGFPTNSFVAFALAVPFIQGALFATMNTGTDLARDIQTGFLNRLTLTPMRGTALLCGNLGGVVVLSLVQAAVYLGVGMITGVRIASGPAGVLTLFAFAALVGLGFGALGAFAALRTGSGEAVQSLFPAFFVFLFISSMNIPRNLIEATWFRDAATANPVSYLLEAVRSLIITGWDAEALALGFGIAAVVAVVALGASSWALRVSKWPRGLPGGRCTTCSRTRRCSFPRWSSRSSSSRPSQAGSRTSATCPASTFPAATRRSSSSSCCCSRRRSAASSPASGSPATSRAASRDACCWPRRIGSGSSAVTRSPQPAAG
jgi:ABC-2 type transport system permease protein